MKKLTTIAFLVGIATTGFAETTTVDFTYANGELGLYGKGKKETVDVAMCIADPSFAGMKLTGFKAYIGTAEGIENASLWMSSDLILKNKVNAPNIASYDVTPVAANEQGNNYALLQVELAEPYVLTSSPLYLGYTIDVTATNTEAQKKPIVYSTGENNNGMYVHMNKSVLKWTDYTATVGGVADIVAFIEGEFQDYSCNIVNYSPIYAMENEEFEAEIFVSNLGVNAINSITYTYSYEGSDQTIENTLTLDNPLEPSLTAAYPVLLPFNALSGKGSHTMNLTLTEVNYEENLGAHAQMALTVNVLPFVPVHRPLIEEFTGLWCGWCTRGYLAMEMIAEQYGDSQVSICYHNGDPMAVTDDYPVNVSGFPSSAIDRLSVIDPYYGTTNNDYLGIAENINEIAATLAIADLNLTASLVDNKVNVSTDASFVQDITNGNYQIGYVLTCSGLTDPSWAQHNYYAGESGYEGTPLQELTEWPSVVVGLVFNDVAVDVTAMRGVAGSLPENMEAGETYNSTYSFNIEGNELIQDVNQLTVAAFIIDKNNGHIVNANKCGLSNAGINDINDSKEVVKTEFFDLSGRKVNSPSKGIYIIRQQNSDGTYKTIKSVVR